MVDIPAIDDSEEHRLHQLRTCAQEILAILQQAQQALDDLKHENDLDALTLLRNIKQLDEHIIHEILQVRVSIVVSREREALILLEREMGEIKILATEAEQVLMKGRRHKAKRLLRRLVTIGNHAVEQERRFIKALGPIAILGAQASLDVIIAYILYHLIEPYAVKAGQAVDTMVFTMEKVSYEVQEFKDQIEHFITLIQKSPRKATNKLHDLWDKAGQWSKEHTGISLPGAEEPTIQNSRAAITEELRHAEELAAQQLKGTKAMVGVPPPPPLQAQQTVEHMLPDVLKFILGGAVIFVFIRYHLPGFIARVWRNREKRKMVQRIASEIERRNEHRFRYIISQLDALRQQAEDKTHAMHALEERMGIIRGIIVSSGATPQLVDECTRLLDAFDGLKRDSVALVHDRTTAIARAGTDLHRIVTAEVAEVAEG